MASNPKKRAQKDGASRACEKKPKKSTKKRSAAQLVSDALRVKKHLMGKYSEEQLLDAVVMRAYENLIRKMNEGLDAFWYAKTFITLIETQNQWKAGSGSTEKDSKITPAAARHLVDHLIPTGTEGSKA